MKKLDIKGLILDLEVKKERLEEEAKEARDQMNEAYGASGEIEILIYTLQSMLK